MRVVTTDFDPTQLAFFTRGAERAELEPTEVATSGWGKDHMHGVAVSGALARELVHALEELDRTDLRASRYTVEMFRPARMRTCRTSHVVVRQSRRLCLVDAHLEQDGEPVARASGLFVATAEPAPGEVWAPPAQDTPQPPPREVTEPLTAPEFPFMHSDAGWTQSFGDHQNGSRKQNWQYIPSLVRGEEPSPFETVACIADSVNMVGNWGSNGVEHINTDIALVLARLPRTQEIGLRAADRVSRDGIAVCTAQVYDREGVLGTAMISSIANVRRTVDLANAFTGD